MTITADQLYALLPAIYRERDAALGIAGAPGPLYEIVGVVAGQLSLVDNEIDQLYDDAFIETCAQWVIPYIGDLVGYLPLSSTAAGAKTPRAEVADTIRYRRWKGTLTILEQLASDVTGWTAVAVEFFQQLTTTQYVNHVRLDSTETVNVRDWRIASTTGTPFDRNSHTIEVRAIATRRGRYNIPNIGVYVWRLGVYDNVEPTPTFAGASQAFAIDANRHTFDPCGVATAPLYNIPPLDRAPFTRTQPQNVPAPLQRRVVADPQTRPLYLGVRPVFVIYDDSGAAIPAADVDICDLSAWTPPTLAGSYVVAVDPQLGRIWVAPRMNPVLVEYAYGFSGPYGAGFAQRTVDPTPETVAIVRDPTTFLATPTLSNAVITAQSASTLPAVVFHNNVTDPTPGAITLGNGQVLAIGAADDVRPVLQSTLTITVNTDAAHPATLTINGLLCAGGIVVTGNGTLLLTLVNATIRPLSAGTAAVQWTGASGSLALEQSLCGALALTDSVTLTASDSIIDGAGGAAIVAEILTLQRATVFGTVAVEQVDLIENSIVTATATSKRLQAGCVRYSYITADSAVPQQYRCQPQMAVEAALATSGAAVAALVGDQLIPRFSAIDYGDPAYGQLGDLCPTEITTGADDGGEMGAFHNLFTTIRERNLEIRLAENIRMGLNAGVLYA